ncbi:MAG: hypothetical protein V7638_2494 [Acidobacteriota bacterium]|jgi:hypothetical protein
MKRTAVIASLCLLVLVAGVWMLLAARRRQQNVKTDAAPAAVEPAKETDVTGKTVAAANAFLAGLDEAGRAKVSFPFNSDEKRRRWSNFPVGMVPRNGMRLGDLNPAQRAAAMQLLAVALSARGLQKVKEIMEGDEVLKNSEEGRAGPIAGGGPPPNAPAGGPPPGMAPGGSRAGMDPGFGRDNYYLAFYGAPSLTEPWMIQFGGHHLAINVTIVGKNNVMTPSLPAAQPAVYKLNSETVRPLGRENDKGFELVKSLDESQQKQAILSYQVNDLVLGPGQDGKMVQPEGIKVSALNVSQQQKLLDVVYEWVGILNDEAAAIKMAEVKANLPETWFAWSGPTTNGSPAYFRVQGPTLWIEYSPQRLRGNTGLDNNHIHTIYRDPTNDYGAKLVQQ